MEKNNNTSVQFINNIKKQKSDVLNKLIFHQNFSETVSDINNLNIRLPNPVSKELDFNSYSFPPNGELVTNIGEIKQHKLNAENGGELINSKATIAAYDESINKYSTLQGEAFLTSHSMIILGEHDYIPMNLLTLYFYTRAKAIIKDSCKIRYSDSPQVMSQIDFINDKLDFLVNYVPDNSILFIDGPLIGGDAYTFMIRAIKRFIDKKVIPVFFVKNSNSNLVTDNLSDLKNKYNSDMHWSYDFLKKGESTNFFKYVDRNNPKNAKVFCYLKGYDLSPQRVEFHAETYSLYKDQMDTILDLIYYMILVQGNKKNPQVRPIAIAEAYARESLKLININQLIKKSGLVPTMNQDRFAW